MKRLFVVFLFVVACSRRASIDVEPAVDSKPIETLAVDSGIEMKPPVSRTMEPLPRTRTHCLEDVKKHMRVSTSVASDQDYLAAIADACGKDEPGLAAAALAASTKADWKERALVLHRAARADGRFDKKCELSDKDALRNMQTLVDDHTLPDSPMSGPVKTGCDVWLGVPWCGLNGGLFEYLRVLIDVAADHPDPNSYPVVPDLFREFAVHVWASTWHPATCRV
jgi:hypothetical protein